MNKIIGTKIVENDFLVLIKVRYVAALADGRAQNGYIRDEL